MPSAGPNKDVAKKLCRLALNYSGTHQKSRNSFHLTYEKTRFGENHSDADLKNSCLLKNRIRLKPG